jgi:hypothetical protein
LARERGGRCSTITSTSADGSARSMQTRTTRSGSMASPSQVTPQRIKAYCFPITRTFTRGRFFLRRAGTGPQPFTISRYRSPAGRDTLGFSALTRQGSFASLGAGASGVWRADGAGARGLGVEVWDAPGTGGSSTCDIEARGATRLPSARPGFRTTISEARVRPELKRSRMLFEVVTWRPPAAPVAAQRSWDATRRPAR